MPFRKFEGRTVDPSMISDMPELNFDDAAGFGDSLNFDGLENDAMYQDNWSFVASPPERGLYSTPLSWEPPRNQLPQPEPSQPPFRPAAPSLTLAQQERLRSIAMPEHLRYQHMHSADLHEQARKSTSVSSIDIDKKHNGRSSSSVSSPDQASNSRKRKSSAEAEDEEEEDGEDGSHPPKKTAHNMIEKRYRTNLNDKIAALRDSVPSLRVMSKNSKGEDTTADREDLQGLTPAHKLNKATVLSKATEYIRHLEKRNKRLQDDNIAMKSRIQAFEKLFLSGAMGIDPSPAPMSYTFDQRDYMSPSTQATASVSPQGMIEVPDDMRRMNAQTMQQNQQLYDPQDRYINTPQHPSAPNGWGGNGFFGKMMVGSLAGLMILEGFSAEEQDGQEPAARGLSSFPTHFLKGIARSFSDSNGFSAMGYHASSSQMHSSLRSLLLFGALLYIILPLFIRAKHPTSNGKISTVPLTAAPSLASSIQVRRQAWLTAIQTVWVPRHNFFLEAAALIMKIVKLSLRNLIGTTGYAILTGITEQQEAARIKAWSIALDAQLGGGDVEISKSRLTLTFLASATLPDTPARLMMKALHIRVLLWELGNAGANDYFMFREIAAKLARTQWNKARHLQLLVSHLGEATELSSEPLAPHLRVLLDQECDDVLNDIVGQRAHNLAWNQATTHNVRGEGDGIDAVVADYAIRSPLDAVSAWFSTLTLQNALSESLAEVPDTMTIMSQVDMAITTAPIGSSAHARALVARAVLIDEHRGASIGAVMAEIKPEFSATLSQETEPGQSMLINSHLSQDTLQELNFALSCATTIAHLSRPMIVPSIDDHISSIKLPPLSQLSFLSFTASYHLMQRIVKTEEVRVRCEGQLESLAGQLRIWSGGVEGRSRGASRDVLDGVANVCLGVVKECVSGWRDEGYGSAEAVDEEGEDQGC